MESLTPEIFDFLVFANIVVGVAIAGRRFLSDIRGPLPEDAPAWAHAEFHSNATDLRSSKDS